MGVNLAVFSARVVQEASRCNVLWSLENPSSSRLWSYPPVAALAGLPDAVRIEWDMCRFGSTARKSTALLTNCSWLRGLSMRCLRNHVHVHLEGKVRIMQNGTAAWKNRTELAGVYSKSLCHAWVKLLCHAAPPRAFGPNPFWCSSWLSHGDPDERTPLAVERSCGDRREADPSREKKKLRDHEDTWPENRRRSSPGSRFARRSRPSAESACHEAREEHRGRGSIEIPGAPHSKPTDRALVSPRRREVGSMARRTSAPPQVDSRPFLGGVHERDLLPRRRDREREERPLRVPVQSYGRAWEQERYPTSRVASSAWLGEGRARRDQRSLALRGVVRHGVGHDRAQRWMGSYGGHHPV